MPEYQNPQHEPGTERRLLLVFLLTFVAIALFQPFLKKYGPPPPSPKTATQETAPQPPTAPAETPASTAPSVVGTKQGSSETETIIENDLYKITFTNRGAQVKSWILKKYDNEEQNGPLDLVNPSAAQKFGYPLSLWTYDENLRNRLSTVLYVPSDQGHQTAPSTITFEYADTDLAVSKTFRFDHSYIVNVETAVIYKRSSVAAFPAWPSGFGDQTNAPTYAASRVDYQNNNNIERVALKKIVGGATIGGPFQWASPADQYFAAVFIPDEPAAAAMVTLHNTMDNPQDAKRPFDVVGAAVGNLHGQTVERLYAGPKDLDVLEAVAVPGIHGAEPDLRGLVDFGWWGLIAKPLLRWPYIGLRWWYRFVRNWGWAIVIQTFIITVLLLPLRITQMKSMLKMQRIAPQIKAVQEKYKKYSLKDPRKAAMNEEISALYKKEGVNPAGGCLPLLIQFPFLIAYYRMLGIALELRHAHWLWVHDLSARDPYFILPTFMLVSMLVTQRMTPQAGMDPAQQKMLTWTMPVVMGFIFYNLAAGLNLYYALSNLISIAQQAIMNRTKLGREMREMMEKRARKKDK